MSQDLPIRSCAFCLRGFKPKRHWQRFCTAACRKSERAERTMAEYVCEYCGLVAATVDHIPPLSIRPVLVELKLDAEYPFIVVKACHECNVILGDRALWTIEQRKSYVAERLRRRYRKYLETPDWTLEELNALEYNLRAMTHHALAVKAVTLKRLERAGSEYTPPQIDIPRYAPAEQGLPSINCRTCNRLTRDEEGFCSDLCEYAMTGVLPKSNPRKFSKQSIRSLMIRLSLAKRRQLKINRLTVLTEKRLG